MDNKERNILTKFNKRFSGGRHSTRIKGMLEGSITYDDFEVLNYMHEISNGFDSDRNYVDENSKNEAKKFYEEFKNHLELK